MNKRQEKLLIATLCGLVATAAVSFVIQPASAGQTNADALVLVPTAERALPLERLAGELDGALHQGAPPGLLH